MEARLLLSADTLIDELFACGMWHVAIVEIFMHFLLWYVKFVIGALLLPALVLSILIYLFTKIIYVNWN